MPNDHYRRTQVAWPTVVSLAATALIIGGAFLWARLPAALLLVGGVVTLILLLFATMTVTVDDSAIEARFGIGLIRKRVPLDQVRSYQVVRNPWYYGWGIHFFPGGTLYNASGLSAVELALASGRLIRIGTAEPDVLAAALQRAAPSAANQVEERSSSIVVAVVAIGIGVLSLSFAGWIVYAGLQPPRVEVTPEHFSVSNGLYSRTVPLRRITIATLEAYIPRVGLKTNGFALGDTLRGTFRMDEWGSAMVFINLNTPPFLVVRSPEGFVIVNFKDPERTRELYTTLTQELDRTK